MNGKVWSCELADAYTLDNKSKTTSVTVMDSSSDGTGTIKNIVYRRVVYNAGTFTLNRGQIYVKNSTSASVYMYGIYNVSGAKAYINGGTIKAETSTILTYAIYNLGGELYVNGGIINVKASGSAKMYIFFLLTKTFYGTGSYPPLQKGLHLKMRHIPKISPIITP